MLNGEQDKQSHEMRLPCERGRVVSAILDHFEEQAGWNEMLGSPFTAELCRRFAEDFEARGPVYDLCKDWPGNPRKDALGLRIAGALHHAVLTGAAPALAAAYPAAKPEWDMAEVWPIAKAWLAANHDHIAAFIKSAPQTNETRRSIALLPGFLELAATFDMPMDLLELGASAGLNQHWDRYDYKAGRWSISRDSDVIITTDWHGPPPVHMDAVANIRSRAACDLNPLEVSDPAQAMRLKCYTWADQEERLTRLDAAMKVAIAAGTKVDRADAVQWLIEKLTNRPKDGLTVVYHSVFLIYPPREDIAAIMKAIADAGAAATADNPIAWLCYESEALFGGDKSSPHMHTRLQIWPGGEAKLLTTSDGHITKIDYHPAGI